jgi:cytoskeletal protein RodZ
MASKKSKKTDISLKTASVEVGKALARSTHTVEETGRKAKKAAEEFVKTASKKAETTVETTLKKVKAAVKKPLTSAAKSKAPLACPLTPGKGMDVQGHIGFLAGEIFHYLDEKGTTPVDKLLKVMKSGANSEALVYSALGWLARECKISFSPDGSIVSLLP